MQCNCIMGIFPSIRRAWLTVDSDIFVWRYLDGDDLAYFDGLSETILSIALVQPKQGIFKDHIKYLLVLATPLDIVMLGVSFADGDINSEMRLLPDALFSLPSDGSYITNIVGSHNGRIFMGGRDGFLYEIAYQASGGWFSRKCNKINHSRSRLSFLVPSLLNVWLSEEDSISQLVVDDTRNILYTRSEKGTITVYDLGQDGWGMSCVAQSSLDSIRRRAVAIASGIEPSNLNELVHIAAVTLQESRQINLVAVTQAAFNLYQNTLKPGVRLYFITCQPPTLPPQPTTPSTTSPKQNLNINKFITRPSGLYLVHVRLPPGFTGSSVQRPTTVHSAHYNAGTLLLSSTTGDDGVLWCINNDMFAFDAMLRETKINFRLDGRSWAIAEVANPPSPLSLAALPSDAPPLPPQIFPTQGCHVFHKLRPVDQLRNLLNHFDPDSNTIHKFFQIYNQGEAACCCIILSSSFVPSDRVIIDKAVAALMHHGGVALPKVSTNQLPSSLAHHTMEPMSPISGTHRQSTLMRTPGGLPVISTPMPGSHPPPLSRDARSPQQHPQSPVQQPAVDPNQVTFYSERQEGVFKMFSRIVRPLWEGRLVEDFVVSRVDEGTISLVIDHLVSLRSFLSKHCLSQPSGRGDFPNSFDRSSFSSYCYCCGGILKLYLLFINFLAEEAHVLEIRSLKQLHSLCDQSIQVFGLWRLLLHHQIHVLFEALDKQAQPSLKLMTFSDVVLSGDSVCKALISALVGQYIDDHSTIDLSSQLRDICPNLYSPDDAICSKASELMSLARTSEAHHRDEQLHEAAKLFQQVAYSVNLPHVIQQYYAVRFYSGVVELCLLAAHKRDEEGLALRLYLSLSSGDEDVDPLVRKSYVASFYDRISCYKCITDMLDGLMVAAEGQLQSPSVPSQPGPPQPLINNENGVGNLTPEEAQHHLALNSEDELFHITLYEWMLRMHLTTQLLKVSSPFVEPFLKRVASSQENNSTLFGSMGTDLLWQYYERAGQFMKAAEILVHLAEKPGSDRDLVKRIEYLSRAKMNSKSSTSHKSNRGKGQILQELEEKLEVAQIQLSTMENLKQLSEHEACEKLNFQLVDVTTLYSEFADPFQLAECKLSIVHCAGLHDPNLVEALWQNIIEHELSKSNNSDTSVLLQHKMVELTKRYMASQRYFPIEFVVGLLEKISCSRGWILNWGVTCFLEARYSLSNLLNVYENVHSQKLDCWSTLGSPHHLLYVVNELISLFLDN
uniref:Nucleoporin Nup133/Nup155-like N-terminal domain-containing protein n=1 Tax=Ciona intestinalis TaxID=7719 RepID=F6TRN8_CIOIN